MSIRKLRLVYKYMYFFIIHTGVLKTETK